MSGHWADLLPDLERSLEALVDHSLLQAQDDPTGEPRLLMLETIREYAAEQLAVSGEEAAARAAHAAHFLALAERHERAGWVKHDPSLPLRLEADLPNLRAALSWLDETGDAEGMQRMAGALRWFWSVRGYVPEGSHVVGAGPRAFRANKPRGPGPGRRGPGSVRLLSGG